MGFLNNIPHALLWESVDHKTRNTPHAHVSHETLRTCDVCESADDLGGKPRSKIGRRLIFPQSYFTSCEISLVIAPQ